MPTDDAVPCDLPPSDPNQAATRFGRFRLAEDGLASDRLLDRSVSLRCVPTATADDLQTEARFYARMQHPGLPCIYDFVRDDGGAALVMPPTVGLTLSAAVAARASGQHVAAIADPTACTLSFISICDALRAAHLRGVVHGELGPDVIIISNDGQIIIEGWSRAMKTVQRPLTMRFCANVPVPVELAADDLHHDIRSLGACFFTALTGEAPPLDAGGQLLTPLEPGQQARIPRVLQTIIRKAMSSSAANGYPSITALRDDLARFLGGQAPQDDVLAAAALWPRMRAAAVILLAILCVAGAVAAFNWRSVSTYATWGRPLVEEDFSNEGWKNRWGSRGRWEQRDGRMVSKSDHDCALIFKKRLSPPVAIEYTGRFDSGIRPGDLSVWWCESDAFALRPDEDVDNARAWWIQAGAYDNSWCTIWQTPARLRTQVNSLVLKPDRDIRFRVEIESDRLRMWIDGELVLEHRELVPIGSGTIALYTWDQGKQFDNVRIWQKEVQEVVSPLVVGDEAMRAERFGDAADAYARVADSLRGRPLGVEALYFQGLALHRQGSHALARKTWQGLPEGILRQRADCLAIDELINDGDVRTAVDRFTTWWNERPQVHDILRQRWQVCGQHLRHMRPLRTAEMLEWIKLRDATFPDDRASRWLVAEMFNVMGAWDETVRRFPDEYRAVAKALNALGRFDEVIASTWAVPLERVVARMGLGDVEGLLASNDLERGSRAELLCKAGRAAEAVKTHQYPAQLYLGRVDDLLVRNAFGKRTNSVLIALGRYEEAAGAGIPGSPESGKHTNAMLLAGWLDEAEKLQVDTRLHRLIAHLIAGRVDEARTLREGLSFNRSRFCYGSWFGQVVGIALIDTALGDATALRKAIERGASMRGWGGRCAMVCAAALDPAQDATLSAMPWRTEAGAWLHVAQALRGELAGDRTAALAAWRAFAALPPIERLLEGHAPSIEVETFARWRLAALAEAAR